MVAEFLLLMGAHVLSVGGTEKEQHEGFVFTKAMWVDWMTKFAILTVSGVQTAILSDEKSLTCSQEAETLALESKWLAALVIAQLLKIILCTLV